MEFRTSIYNIIGNYTSTYYWKRILDYIQVSLDGFGILDPTGVADGINSVIYLARGQGAYALISAVAMLPYIGDIAKIG